MKNRQRILAALLGITMTASLVLFGVSSIPAAEQQIETSNAENGEEVDGPVVVNSPEDADWWTPVTEIDFSSKSDVKILNEDGSESTMNEAYFTSTEVAPGTWQILGDGDYAYLVEGDNEAICIDTGYGAGNIREYCEILTNKPVKYVINTHYHFDHTAGNAYFDCAFMTEESVSRATIPYASFDGIEFPRNYPVVVIKEGYTFDLGGRSLEVIEVPNHTVGGIVLLDRKNKILFAGDEIMSPTFAMVKVSVEQYKENMEKLAAVSDDFNLLCCGYGVYDDTSCINKFIEVADSVINGDSVEDNSGNSGEAEKKEETDETVYTRHSPREGDDADALENSYTPNITLNYEGIIFRYYKDAITKNDDIKNQALMYKSLAEAGDDSMRELEYEYSVKGAELGYTRCMLCLGEIYQAGFGPDAEGEEAIDKAIEWWEKAADAGEPHGWTNIGQIYAHIAIPGGSKDYANFYEGDPDYEKAMEYLEKATEAGDFKAPRQIAVLYETGVLGKPDFEKAVEYYKKAADAGDATGKLKYADYLLRGEGIEQDVEEALDIYQGLIDNEAHDYEKAALAMGEIYEEGTYVEADVEKAISYYKIASEKGIEDAEKALERLSE